jgi:1-deoxy-D-xylulose-5-phosphate reductoisomerase
LSIKRVAILGSTGSIGCNALEVIEHLGYRLVALSGHRQLDKLAEQAKRFDVAAIGVADENCRGEITSRLSQFKPQVYVGADGLSQMVTRDDVDIVLAAIVGSAGLAPVLAAVGAGKTVALANKESLVVAGSLLIPLARKSGATIVPVDSEHSAIYQAMACGKLHEVKRIILTASGGPFRSWPIEKIQSATLADALNHPTWRMGDKITIDSATMFNKALEIIEACWLFDVPAERIEVVIHPQSVVHSMVEYVDGSVIAQLSPPDMRTPIQYALTYPDRVEGISRRMDWSKRFALDFEPPDPEKFGALKLAYEVAKRKATYGAVLNAANEAAVAAFVAGKIPFGMICQSVEHTIAAHRPVAQPSLEDLLAADHWARHEAQVFMADETPASSASSKG